MTSINFGVWGLGRIGQVHCRSFSQNKDQYQLVAVCDTDDDRVKQVATMYHSHGYTDAAGLLNDTSVELLIIATRSLDHATHARMALEAGKIVLLEKPIGVTEQDYHVHKQLNDMYPSRLFFLHNHRFEPAFQEILKITHSGILGNIHLIKLCRHHPFRRRADWQALLTCGGGQLSCWGPHILDHAMQLIQSPIKNVFSHLQRINTPGDADDHVKIMLVGENDCMVDLEISDATALRGTFCTVYGNRGSMVCADEKTIQLKYIDPDYELPTITASVHQPPTKGGTGQEETFPWIEKSISIPCDVSMWEQVEIDIANNLYQSIRHKKPFPIANADAIEIVRITNLVKQQNPQFAWVQ